MRLLRAKLLSIRHFRSLVAFEDGTKDLKRLTRKVVIYCVRQGRLLVMRHLDCSADKVGLQVPAGSIRDGEDRTAAALRELEEETGQTGFTINARLGRSFYDISPYRNEVQGRFFFLASAPSNIGRAMDWH